MSDNTTTDFLAEAQRQEAIYHINEMDLDRFKRQISTMGLDRFKRMAEEEKQNEETPDQNTSDEGSGFWETLGENVAEILPQIVRGAQESVNETYQTALDIGDLVQGAVSEEGPKSLKPGVSSNEEVFSEDWMPDKPETITGNIVNDITQFAVGMIGPGKILKAFKFINKAARAVAASAASDAFAFDPHEKRASNFLNEIGLSNTVTEYLAADEDDSSWEGRLKNAIEGTGIGFALEGLRYGIRSLKQWRNLGRTVEEMTSGAVSAEKAVPQEIISVGKAATNARTELKVLEDTRRALNNLNQHVIRLTNADLSTIDEAIKFTDDSIAGKGVDYDSLSPQAKLLLDEYADLSPEKARELLTALRAKFAEQRGAFHQERIFSEENPAFKQLAEQVRKGVEQYRADRKALNKAIRAARKRLEAAEKEWGETLESQKFRDLHPAAQTRLKEIVDDEQALGDTLDDLKASGGESKGAAPKVEQPEPNDSGGLLFRISEDDTRDILTAIKNGDYAGAARGIDFNFERTYSEEDVLKTIDALSDKFSTKITKAKGGEVETWGEVARVADIVGEDPKVVQKALTNLFGSTEQLSGRFLATRLYLHSLTNHLNSLAAKIDAHKATDEDFVQFARMIELTSNVQAMVKGIQTNIARSLNAMKLPAGPKLDLSGMQIDAVIRAGGGRAKMRDLAKLIRAAETPAGVMNVIKKSPLRRAVEMGIEYFINSILSGPLTHSVNMTSGAITTLWLPMEIMVGGLMKKGYRISSIREGLAMYYALGETLIDSVKLLGKALTLNFDEGFRASAKTDPFAHMVKYIWDEDYISPYVRNSALEVDNRAITAANFGINRSADSVRNVIGGVIDFGGKVVRLNSRFLRAEDAIFKGINYRMELRRLAFREGLDKGLKGRELAEYIERTMRNPSKAQHELALLHGERATYTEQLAEGSIGASFEGLVMRHPGLRLLFPFIRTVTNILKFTFQRTPGIQLLSRQFREELTSKNPLIQRMAYGKLMMGAALWYTAMNLAINGYLTGDTPRTERKAESQAGRQRYGVTWVDDNGKRHYVAYNRADPFGMFLGLSTDMVRLYGEMDDEEWSELATMAVMALAQNLTSKTYFTAVTNLVQALTEPDRYAERFLENYAGTLVPNLFAQMNTRVEGGDPYLREVNSVLDAIKARTPGWSETLPPRRNIWGEPIEAPKGAGIATLNPFYHTIESDSPIRKLIADLDMDVRLPPKKIGAAVELTPEQYDRLVFLAGQVIELDGMTMEERLNAMMPVLKQLPPGNDDYDGGQKTLIRKTISKYRQAALHQLLKEDPELMERYRQDLRNRALMRRPGGQEFVIDVNQ